MSVTERQAKIDSLTQRGGKLLGHARDLQRQEDDEVNRPILRKSVGKCFKFLNSYGAVDAKWWLYAKIISIDEKNLNFVTVQFQHTSRKRVEIEYEHVYNFNGRNRFNERDGWTEISVVEYNKAKESALRFVRNLLAR